MSAFLAVEALSSLSSQALGMLADEVPSGPQALGSPAPIAGSAGSAESSAAIDGTQPVTGSFGQLVADGLARVNNQLIGSQVELQRLALGDAQNLHQIMINLEESRLSFQLMMQVRNRLLEAYQDVMKMPI